MKQQYQQQYVTSLLGDQDPTDYHSKLWEWYEKYDKPGREKRLAQDAANEQRRVQIAKEQGLVPLIDKLSKAGLAGLKLKKVLDKQAKKTEVKEKGKFWQNWEAMDRSKSDVDYDLIEQNIFKTASDEYDGDFKRLWKDETRLRELTAGLPQEIREKYLKLSPSEIVWAREYQGLRRLDTLTQDQFHSELTEAGDYQEYLKSDNKSQQYKAWMLNKLDPFEFSDGQLSKVLYKGLNRLSNSAEEIRFCCNFAVPSNVFNTTFPVNPSVTNTSAFFVEKSLPSIFPTKFKLLFFNNLYAAFSTSRPLVSSSPLFRIPTLGLSISIITSANFAPIIPY